MIVIPVFSNIRNYSAQKKNDNVSFEAKNLALDTKELNYLRNLSRCQLYPGLADNMAKNNPIVSFIKKFGLKGITFEEVASNIVRMENGKGFKRYINIYHDGANITATKTHGVSY